MIEIGKLDLKDRIVISDPCYCDFDNPWIKQLKIVPGEYNCFIEYNTKNEERVASMLLINKNTNDKNIDEKIAEVGVDSGTMAIFTLDKYTELSKMKKEYEEEFYKYSYDLTKRTFFKFNEYMADIFQNIFISSSGYGDGIYNVLIKRNKIGHIIAIKIDFINEYNEDYYLYKDDEEEEE